MLKASGNGWLKASEKRKEKGGVGSRKTMMLKTRV